jgi:hypothetical protein
MAAVTLTYSEVKGLKAETGQFRSRVYDVGFAGAGADNYPVGGLTPDARSVGLLNILAVRVVGQRTNTGAANTKTFDVKFDPVLNKLQLFTSNGAAPAALAEATVAVTITTDLGVIVYRLEFLGV